MSEAQQNHSVDVLAVTLGHVASDVAEIKAGMAELAKGQANIGVLDLRTKHTDEALARAFGEVAELDKRVKAVEVVMPQLEKAEKAARNCVYAVVGLVGLAVAKTVIYDPAQQPRVVYVQAAPAAAPVMSSSPPVTINNK